MSDDLFIPYCSCGSSNLVQIIDTYRVVLDGKEIVVPDVPASQCENCHEIHYSNIASRLIDEKIAEFRKSNS